VVKKFVDMLSSFMTDHVVTDGRTDGGNYNNVRRTIKRAFTSFREDIRLIPYEIRTLKSCLAASSVYIYNTNQRGKLTERENKNYEHNKSEIISVIHSKVVTSTHQIKVVTGNRNTAICKIIKK